MNPEISMVCAIVYHYWALQMEKAKSSHFCKHHLYGSLWPTTDVYLAKPLKGFKQDLIGMPQHQSLDYIYVVATQLPLIRNPLAPI